MKKDEITNAKILSLCDHTLLKPSATSEQIRKAVKEAGELGCASVCIPPSYVKEAHLFSKEKVKICTVIGFPTGYQTTEVKVFEAKAAVCDGADEIDMVANIGWIKDGKYEKVLDEINAVKASVGEKTLKVIIETSELTREEKIKMAEIVSKSDADYIKTSTGFSSMGATPDDIALLSEHMSGGKGIKASGGISSLEDARELIMLGATRLGTSKIVNLIKKQTDNGGN